MNITITLAENEIIAAIKNYLAESNIISSLDGKADITIVPNRGTTGCSAVLTITQGEPVHDAFTESPPELSEPVKRKRGPNKPKNVTPSTNMFDDAETELDIAEDTEDINNTEDNISEDFTSEDVEKIEESTQSSEVESLFG